MTNSNGQGGSAPSPDIALDGRKRAVRAASLALLRACDPEAGIAVGQQIQAHVALPPGSVVGGFYPLNRELDLTPLLQALRQAGHVVALPRTPPLGLPLAFHRWAETDELFRERFGTTSSRGPVVVPDLLLVPLLAFDRSGHRLGYGGGYYDRTLAAMPGVRTVGCAYADLERAEVPSGPTDAVLHAIATETEFITVKAPPCASSF